MINIMNDGRTIRTDPTPCALKQRKNNFLSHSDFTTITHLQNRASKKKRVNFYNPHMKTHHFLSVCGTDNIMSFQITVFILIFGLFQVQGCAPTTTITHDSEKAFKTWANRHNVPERNYDNYKNSDGEYVQPIYDQTDEETVLGILYSEMMAEQMKMEADVNNKEENHDTEKKEAPFQWMMAFKPGFRPVNVEVENHKGERQQWTDEEINQGRRNKRAHRQKRAPMFPIRPGSIKGGPRPTPKPGSPDDQSRISL